MIKYAFLGLVLLVAGFLVFNHYIKEPPVRAGEKAPAINTNLISGQEFSLSDLRGKYVLVDFWGSWCAPCIKEIPKLKAIYEEYNNATFQDSDGFEIVSIALEKSDKYTRKLIEQKELNWPYHIIEVSRFVMMSEYAQSYGVSDLPSTFLVNPEGYLMGNRLSLDAISEILDSRIE